MKTLRQRALSCFQQGFSRRQAGILYADIANYSLLTERDEEGTHIRLVECMKIMKTHITANGGRSAHFAGDAVLAEFSNASSALQCAIDAQLALYRWNRRLPPGQKLQFRVGVNFGEVISDQGDIYGHTVNLATRLEGLAKPGGICVSDSVRMNVGATLAARLVSIGKQHVKHISKPLQAFSIEIAPGPCSLNHFQSTRLSPACLTMLPT
jgi:adenylate cyclase